MESRESPAFTLYVLVISQEPHTSTPFCPSAETLLQPSPTSLDAVNSPWTLHLLGSSLRLGKTHTEDEGGWNK